MLSRSEERHSKGVLNEVHRNNGQGLLKAKINLFTEKVDAWGMATHYDLPSQEVLIRPPCEVPFQRTAFLFTAMQRTQSFLFKHKVYHLQVQSDPQGPEQPGLPIALVLPFLFTVPPSLLPGCSYFCLRAFALAVLARDTLPSSPTSVSSVIIFSEKPLLIDFI